jgi:hypothetical protein
LDLFHWRESLYFCFCFFSFVEFVFVFRRRRHSSYYGSWNDHTRAHSS